MLNSKRVRMIMSASQFDLERAASEPLKINDVMKKRKRKHLSNYEKKSSALARQGPAYAARWRIGLMRA